MSPFQKVLLTSNVMTVFASYVLEPWLAYVLNVHDPQAGAELPQTFRHTFLLMHSSLARLHEPSLWSPPKYRPI